MAITINFVIGQCEYMKKTISIRKSKATLQEIFF